MNEIAFTSEHVCDNIARRTVRDALEKTHKNTKQFGDSLIMPIARKLSTSGRLPRGSLMPTCANVVKQLENDDTVVDIEYNAFRRSSISANERHRLAYISASPQHESEDWLDFATSELWLSRKEFDFSITGTEFSIHRHALSRYMHREMKPAEKMLADVADAVRASALMGAAVISFSKHNHIAIALKEGLLLGRVLVIDSKESPPTSMTMKMSKKGCFHDDERPRPNGYVKGYRPLTQMMTYIDGSSMSPDRVELHNVVSEFQQKHAIALKYAFDFVFYRHVLALGHSQIEMEKRLEAARNDARLLLKTEPWLRYTETAGTGK